jgi:hypothetical protein
MKILNLLSSVPILVLFAAPVQAAVFAADFETLVEGDLNGKGGWNTSETTPEATYVLPGLGSKAGFIGFVPSVSSGEVYTKNTFGGITNLANAQFSVLFEMADSSNAQPNRDTFGFRLKDSSGTNLFSIFLNPELQSGTPAAPGDVGRWKLAYTTGSGAQVPLYSNPEQTLVWAVEESTIADPATYAMTISFAELGLSGDVQMNIALNGLTIGGGVLDGLASSSINEVGAFWRPTVGPSATGDNGMFFDNVTVVPEPGVAGLAGLAGLLCLMVRRRA